MTMKETMYKVLNQFRNESKHIKIKMSFFGKSKSKGGKSSSNSSSNSGSSSCSSKDPWIQSTINSLTEMGERLSQIEIVETETPNAFVYTLNFPNVRRNDWNVFTTTISQINLLEIYGKQTGTKESGSFNRFWMLPRNVKRNNMQVKKEDGMVTVTFPK
ncbi:17.6 kDa class I heat shock protein 2-like [Camellia sinensis]|uniref:17.6 kDa class I heat shock protein 2-like n=1 Tax=Camellia sinensis TaxID=4442 RepID=UPI0010367EE0|nr:17.6 kDa class I heat shock protein 2-like [Camellia sinensis]